MMPIPFAAVQSLLLILSSRDVDLHTVRSTYINKMVFTQIFDCMHES